MLVGSSALQFTQTKQIVTGNVRVELRKGARFDIQLDPTDINEDEFDMFEGSQTYTYVGNSQIFIYCTPQDFITGNTVPTLYIAPTNTANSQVDNSTGLSRYQSTVGITSGPQTGAPFIRETNDTIQLYYANVTGRTLATINIQTRTQNGSSLIGSSTIATVTDSLLLGASSYHRPGTLAVDINDNIYYSHFSYNYGASSAHNVVFFDAKNSFSKEVLETKYWQDISGNLNSTQRYKAYLNVGNSSEYVALWFVGFSSLTNDISLSKDNTYIINDQLYRSGIQYSTDFYNLDSFGGLQSLFDITRMHKDKRFSYNSVMGVLGVSVKSTEYRNLRLTGIYENRNRSLMFDRPRADAIFGGGKFYGSSLLEMGFLDILMIEMTYMPFGTTPLDLIRYSNTNNSTFSFQMRNTDVN